MVPDSDFSSKILVTGPGSEQKIDLDTCSSSGNSPCLLYVSHGSIKVLPLWLYCLFLYVIFYKIRKNNNHEMTKNSILVSVKSNSVKKSIIKIAFNENSSHTVFHKQIQWKLSKTNLLETNYCVRNKQVFSLHGLN